MAPTTVEGLPPASEELYLAAAKAAPDETGARGKVFFPDELAEMAGARSNQEVIKLIQPIQNRFLFRLCKKDHKVGWTVRSQKNAKQIAALEKEERPIYELIEESHDQGMWAKALKSRVPLAPNAVTKILNKMEKAGLVKSVKSIKGPAQKIYMMAEMKPSEDVTGNSFYDAGELDESFRDELMNLIVFWVRNQSWADGKKKPRKEPTSPILVADDVDSGSKKRKRTSDIEDLGGRPRYRISRFNPHEDFKQLAYRAGTRNYPTAEDIHNFLIKTDVIKPMKAKTLTVEEIRGCIDVLCWDEKLEKMPNKDGIAWGYRTVRGVNFHPSGLDSYEEHVGTGLTQMPCGRCPVYELCREDGPVNPQECVYFQQWLNVR